LRSVEEPVAADTSNVHGTVVVLKAAVDAGVRRVIYASSSSVYGIAEAFPTPESAATLPRSPYATTKLAGEHYCRVFADVYGLETISLRYFNAYGPRQRPDSAYAAVVPRFIDALRKGRDTEVHGDGQQSRDFTYVADVIRANLAASVAPAAISSGRIYNVAAGSSHSVLELLAVLGRILGVEPTPIHTELRPGDIRHSCADARAARRDLGFECAVGFEEGLRLTVDWFVSR